MKTLPRPQVFIRTLKSLSSL